MKKKILIYGILLAALTFLLNAFHYYYFVKAFPLEIYMAAIAILFLAVGIWAGRRLTAGKHDKPAEFRPNTKALEHLGISDREMDVLKLMAEGLSNQQIADRLYISIHTVKTHVSNLLAKLEVNRRTQAIQKARSFKMIK